MSVNEYTIIRTAGAPDWDKVPVLEVGQVQWLPDAGIRMTQQVCYDESGLYIRQRAVEKNVRAEYTDPLSPVCEDSCMEFFFRPDETDSRYFNFEINPNGCMYIGLRRGRNDAVRLLPPRGAETFALRAARTADGWEVEYKVPLDFIRLGFPGHTFRPGAVLYANCYKCGDKTVQPHYVTWNTVTSEEPDYHRPQDFGKMVLGE